MSRLAEWFAIFRTGTHRASNGVERSYSRADLDELVAAYDGGAAPSPCVVTHEELYSPFAYAQIAEIRRKGEVLEARCNPEKIQKKFARLVEKGRLTARSVQILPTPDGLRLGHVAFLGAEPPAVEGLEPISFSAAGLSYATDDAWEQVDAASAMARVKRALREIARKVFGADEADQIMSQWEVDSALEDVAARRERAIQQEDPPMSDSVTYSQADLDAKIAEAIAAERGRNQAAAARAARAAARIAALKEAGKLLPAQEAGLLEFVAGLDDTAEALEFTAGETTTKTSPRAYFFALLDGLPARVDLSSRELAGGDAPPSADSADPHDLHRRALDYRAEQAAKGVEVSIPAAVRHVTGDV